MQIKSELNLKVLLSIQAVKYFQMPQLNKFDDFDACMGTFGDNAKYCYVRTALKPDPSSELYNFIAEFSNMKKQHFRHDKLTRGVCINSCQILINALRSSAADYFIAPFKLNYTVTTNFLFIPSST